MIVHSCCQVIRQDDPDQLTPHLFLSSLNTNEELKERVRGDLRAHIHMYICLRKSEENVIENYQDCDY